MAVAEKTSDARTKGGAATVQVLSLAGLVYVVASLAVVLWAIPTYGPPLLAQANVNLPPYMQATLLGGVMLVAVVLLGFVGRGLIGTKVVGVRAGIFTAFVAALTILLVGAWFGGVMEWLTFDKGWFGAAGKTVGWVTTAVFTGFLVLFFLRWFFAAGTDKWLVAFEEGGWFSWAAYKPQQGHRVRRGTVIGLLILGGAGVYTLVSSNALAQYQEKVSTRTAAELAAMTDEEKKAEARKPLPFDGWSVGVPFTGTLTLQPPTAEERAKGETGAIGDAGPLFASKLGWDPENPTPITVDRWFLRDEINANLDPARFVYLNIDNPARYEGKLKTGVMSKADFQQTVEELKEKGVRVEIDESPESRDLREPIPAGNPGGRKDRDRLYTTGAADAVKLSYLSIPLLPHVRYTVPLLLLALTLWLAWRLVNYPPFGDFLIATEAELNKVSWTTRKRLFQDTIVVLVTLALMAGFLLIVDLTCRNVLSSSWVKVIQINPDEAGGKKAAGPKPW